MVDEEAQDLIHAKEAEKPEKSDVRKKVEEFLGKKYEVTLADGRLIRGVLIATDKDANMIFHASDERWSQNPAKGVRHLGQAMISKKHVVAMYEWVDEPGIFPTLPEYFKYLEQAPVLQPTVSAPEPPIAVAPAAPAASAPTAEQPANEKESASEGEEEEEESAPSASGSAKKKRGPKPQKKKNKGKKRK